MRPEFEKIIERFLNEMGGVDCSVSEYQEALDYAQDMVGASLQASKEMDGEG